MKVIHIAQILNGGLAMTLQTYSAGLIIRQEGADQHWRLPFGISLTHTSLQPGCSISAVTFRLPKARPGQLPTSVH